MNTLTDFINYELYPALFDRLDEAFPDMDFEMKGGNWQSSHYLNGEETYPTRNDKTVVTRKHPSRILEQGGDSLTLVDFHLQRLGLPTSTKGAELVEALRPLCVICGLEIPTVDSEEYRAYREKQDRLERTAYKMQRELFSPAGAEVLRYLKETRGYSESEIKDMELGYCSTETASQLDGAPYGAGEIYTLAIPYRSGNSILGFKLRALDADVKPKYKNTSGLPKKASFFGLTGLRLTGDGAKDRDITIVEGELDALHAQAVGVENIVAAAGGELSEEALQEAKKRGVRRITLLFDTEQSEDYAASEARAAGASEDTARRKAAERIAENERKREKAIRLVQSEGLEALVAELPSEDGEKVDVDSFLRTHGKEQLQKEIDGAVTGAKYLFYGILERTIAKQGGEGETITDKYFGDYKQEVIELVNDTVVTSPVDRDAILALFAKSAGGAGITKEAIQAEADRKKEIADKERQREQTVNTAKRALELVDAGRVEDGLRLMQASSAAALKISKETEYGSLLAKPTITEIRSRLKTRPEGITTDYVFSKRSRSERLVLPAGALTLLCGGTSHGKSVFLRTLALQTALSEKDGSVLYFSFEEDFESTIVEFVNAYVNRELTTPTSEYNNLSTITEYYRSGSVQYVKKAERENFLNQQEAFLKDVVETGRLRIIDSDLYSNELVDAITYLARNIKVKAVFIDYVQLLYKQGVGKVQRNEELKAIAKELRQLAKSLTLPVILAAQLNRDAKSPTEMHSQNIADSADLEREANKVLLIWNSAFKPSNGSNYKEDEIEAEKRPTLGKEGELYVLLSKNRGGLPTPDAKLIFNGNCGRVEPNYKPKEKQLSLKEALFKDEEGDGDLPY